MIVSNESSSWWAGHSQVPFLLAKSGYNCNHIVEKGGTGCGCDSCEVLEPADFSCWKRLSAFSFSAFDNLDSCPPKWSVSCCEGSCVRLFPHRSKHKVTALFHFLLRSASPFSSMSWVDPHPYYNVTLTCSLFSVASLPPPPLGYLYKEAPHFYSPSHLVLLLP